jgi:hypothetical protein
MRRLASWSVFQGGIWVSRGLDEVFTIRFSESPSGTSLEAASALLSAALPTEGALDRPERRVVEATSSRRAVWGPNRGPLMLYYADAGDGAAPAHPRPGPEFREPQDGVSTVWLWGLPRGASLEAATAHLAQACKLATGAARFAHDHRRLVHEDGAACPDGCDAPASPQALSDYAHGLPCTCAECMAPSMAVCPIFVYVAEVDQWL